MDFHAVRQNDGDLLYMAMPETLMSRKERAGAGIQKPELILSAVL